MSDLYYCYVFKLCTQPSGVEVTNNQLVNLSVNWKLFVSKESIKYFKSLAYFLCVSAAHLLKKLSNYEHNIMQVPSIFMIFKKLEK